MRDKKSNAQLSLYKMVKARKLWHTEELMLYSRNCQANGYQLSAQRFVRWFGWTSITYDWLMVA